MLKRFGQKSIPDGVLAYGEIKDRRALVAIYRDLAREQNLQFVRCSLPEEKAYVFKTEVPALKANETRENILFQIEENVPLKSTDVVFDYVLLPSRIDMPSEIREAVVSVFPRNIVDEYVSLYDEVGLIPISLEMEADALARALVSRTDSGCYMIVDFGQQRTGLSIVERGAVQFTSTVDVGGNLLTAAIAKQYNVSIEEAEQIKREETFVGHGVHREFFASLMNSVSALSDEMNRHYVYWHTHSDKKGKKLPLIQKIILCGGDANLGGLAEHLSLMLKAKVELGNVWTNILSVEDTIPEISFAASLSYATALGLSLRDV